MVFIVRRYPVTIDRAQFPFTELAIPVRGTVDISYVTKEVGVLLTVELQTTHQNFLLIVACSLSMPGGIHCLLQGSYIIHPKSSSCLWGKSCR